MRGGVLIFCSGDVGRTVLPVVVAQDAEGESAGGLGGWGLGVAFPPQAEVVRLLMECIGRGVPRESEVSVSGVSVKRWVQMMSDKPIPLSWTSGDVVWHHVLARAHSYREGIMMYEARVFLRSVEVIAKIHDTRRSHLLGLEDNAGVVGAWAHGRSPTWHVNALLRRRTALEVAADVSVAAAWCGTKRMPMDELSRERVVRRTVLPAQQGR